MTDQLLSQQSTAPADGDREVDPALVARAHELAARGTVLLRNEGVLPFAAGEQVALFGRVQHDWICVGYGSGGDVNAPYLTTLLGSLRESGAVAVDAELADRYTAWCTENPVDPGIDWGKWPRHYPEMPLEDEAIEAAARRAEVGVVVIGRAAGEDRENTLEPGSYLLTDDERSLLERVSRAFARTVVIVSTGNVMDLGFVEELEIDALVLAWLGGMEGGSALADVLTGVLEPGGRLASTIARRYEDHPSSAHFGDPEANDYVEDVFVGYRYFETFAPETVLFPFGAGRGYTTFDIAAQVEEAAGAATGAAGRTAIVRATVTNTGERAGSEVVQVYVAGPDAALPAPARVLAGFARTPQLEPGAAAEVEISVPLADLARYDDAGVVGPKSAYVLVPGAYELLVGTDVRSAAAVGSLEVAELEVVRQLEEAAAANPEHPFDRIVPQRAADGTVVRDERGVAVVGAEPVPTATVDLRERILSRLPAEIAPAGAPGAEGAEGSEGSEAAADAIRFEDVAAGRAELDAFLAQLSVSELASLTYGDITMDSPLGAPGNAGALGGVTEALRERGIPAATTTDGPSGIRLSAYASLLPCGTALASSWDPQAVRELAALHGQEMIRKGSHILLSPGMNIHRDPLCGRNFEYFSEDPLITGRMGAAVVGGVQSQGVSACPKHFAANNQETNRVRADSRLSERALREIYLRGFEICVAEAAPRWIMTSYNRLNGVWAHYHYDLVTTILRGEWDYRGAIMTDWWMTMAQDPLFPALKDSAYRVRAQVDVLMPGSILHSGDEREDAVVDSHALPEGITLGEIQRSARTVLQYLLDAGLVGDADEPAAAGADAS
ncbi:glycoside hydrolase family 3 protein [Brachybacterium sp. DNPG3]